MRSSVIAAAALTAALITLTAAGAAAGAALPTPVWGPPETALPGDVPAQIQSVLMAPGGRVTAFALGMSGPNAVARAAVRDAGGGWPAPVTLSDPGRSATAGEPVVLANGTFAVACLYADGHGEVRTLAPGSTTWSAPDALPAAAEAVALAGVPGGIAALWTGPAGVQFSTRSLTGGPWTSAETLAAGGVGVGVGDPTLFAPAGGGLVALWKQSSAGSSSVHAAVRRSGMSTFGAATTISATADDVTFFQLATMANGEVLAAWSEQDEEGFGSRVATLAASSSVWSEPATVGHGAVPQLATGGGQTALATTDFGDYYRGYVSVRGAGGDFGTPTVPAAMSADPFTAISSLAARPDGTIYAVNLHGTIVDDQIEAVTGALLRRDPVSGSWSTALPLPGEPVMVQGRSTLSADAAGDLAYGWVAPDGSVRVVVGDGAAPRLTRIDAPESAVAGESVRFTARAEDTLTPAVAVSWDFGDGQTATGESSSHTFPAAGLHTITISAVDDVGHVTSTTRRIWVRAAPADVPPATAPDQANAPPGAQRQPATPPSPAPAAARISGRKVLIDARVYLRRGRPCRGTVTVSVGGVRGQVALNVEDGRCRAQGTLLLRSRPSSGKPVRITLSARRVATRRLTARR